MDAPSFSLVPSLFLPRHSWVVELSLGFRCFAKSRVCLPSPSQENLYDLHLYKDSHLAPMQVQLGLKLNRYPFLDEAMIAQFCFSEQ